MFIKNLRISTQNSVIRDMHFNTGMNLIIDETPSSREQLTGNNVGKTTVLKLVDYCLGGNANIIYTDPENKKSTYDHVKDFLVDNEVLIRLILVDNLVENSTNQVIIERNFLTGNKAIRTINGEDILVKDFEGKLLELLIPQHKAEKPTFRQILSHNIRYKDLSINNTLKTLNQFSTDAEYETLYLFLLGCVFEEGDKKQSILAKIRQEEAFRERLEKKQPKTSYELALSMIEDEIKELQDRKSKFNLNKDFEKDLNALNAIKYQINKKSSLICNLNIRRNLIEEAQAEIELKKSTIDLTQIKMLYAEATKNVSGIQKTFDELVDYHNNMLVEKIKFITAELPDLKRKIKEEENIISDLLKKEEQIAKKIARGDSFEELEAIIRDLTEKYRLKGEYESIISQLDDVENSIEQYRNELSTIDAFLFSQDFEDLLKIQVTKFNKHFAAISNELYGEKYALTYEKTTNKNNQRIYKFSSFNLNMSSGKKQGEILCFDLAYILFADQEELPCLHFLLNDKKELMHGNQLAKVAEFVRNRNIQLVVSILKDKLPDGLLEKSNIVVMLSQDSKLFKIEENK